MPYIPGLTNSSFCGHLVPNVSDSSVTLTPKECFSCFSSLFGIDFVTWRLRRIGALCFLPHSFPGVRPRRRRHRLLFHQIWKPHPLADIQARITCTSWAGSYSFLSHCESLWTFNIDNRESCVYDFWFIYAHFSVRHYVKVIRKIVSYILMSNLSKNWWTNWFFLIVCFCLIISKRLHDSFRHTKENMFKLIHITLHITKTLQIFCSKFYATTVKYIIIRIQMVSWTLQCCVLSLWCKKTTRC